MSYKVVKIVNEYLVVVNYGSKDNAKEGDILEIFETGEEVFDPDTSESLGTLDISKGKIKVKNVYENMSLCESYQKTANSHLSNFSNALSYLSNSMSTTETKPLRVDTKEISGGYDEEELTVRLSDPVKIVKSLYQEELIEKQQDDEEEYE